MRGDAQLLTRYWIKFDTSTAAAERQVARRGAKFGCGVTAYGYEDALTLLRWLLFDGEPLPPVAQVIESVDIRTLDQGHVAPNIGLPVWRGLWFPGQSYANYLGAMRHTDSRLIDR